MGGDEEDAVGRVLGADGRELAGGEEELLRSTVRRFLAEELPPARVRELDQARRWPRELWTRMAELGWTGMMVPERYGGPGAPPALAAALIEELARGFASVAVDLVLAFLGARLLLELSSEAQREQLLRALARGETIVALGLSEPGAGTDLSAVSTRAELHGDEWTIRGQKLYTSMADEADWIMLLARTDPPPDGHRTRGLSLILVPTHQPGVSVRRLALMGMRAAATCEVFFDEARAPAEVIGRRGRGFHHLLSTLHLERILGASISLGIATAAFEEAIEYAAQRSAFGRPIGAFQAVQHGLVDTAIEIAQSRALIAHASRMDAADPACARDACMAKVSAAETAVRATDRGMRILGAYGMVEDSPMERYLRDARLGVFSPISNEMARNVIGEQLGLPKSY